MSRPREPGALDADAPDEPRDPWLREALRHAPDASVAAPGPLSDAILKAARTGSPAMVQSPAMRPSIGARIQAAWAWLGRLPVAAGFAGVLAATMVGLLWWDRPLDDAMPRSDRERPSATAPIREPATGSSSTPSTPSPAVPQASPAPADARTAASEARERSAKAAPPTIAPRRESAALSRKEARAGTDAPASSNAERNAAAADSLDARSSRARTPSAESRATPDSGAAAPALRKDAAPRGSFAPSTVASAISSLRAAIDAEPGRWSWQRDDAAPRPVDAPLQRWLGMLESALASLPRSSSGLDERGPSNAGVLGRPSDTPADSTAQSAAGSTTKSTTESTAAAPTTLRFLRDGRLHTTLRIDARAVSAEPTADPTAAWRRALDEDTAAGLRRELPAASR
jgi:hypothetical protein